MSPAYVHEAWTVRDGLPVNGLTAVLQGRDGYLWLTTWDGLVRFDGARFVVFNAGNSGALPSSRLVQAVELPDGSLFLRTAQNHVVRWHAGAFTYYDVRRGLPDAGTHALYRDPAGRLWAATDSGVRRLDGDRFVPVAPAIRAPVATVLLDRGGTLWVGTIADGAYRVQGTRVTHYDAASGLTAGSIDHLAQSRDGTVWAGADSGLYRIRGDRAERAAQQGGPPVREVLDLRTPPAGVPGSPADLWVATQGAVYTAAGGILRPVLTRPAVPTFVRFDPTGVPWYGAGDALYRDGQLVFRGPPPPAGVGRGPANIEDLTWDHEGSVWIATTGNGLLRLKPALFGVYSEAEGLATRTVWSVFEDRAGALWFGLAGNGAVRLAGGTITSFLPTRRPPTIGAAVHGALASGDAQRRPWFVTSFMQDRQGDVWLGSMYEGAFRCRLPALACKQVLPPTAEHRTEVRALYEDEAGDVWAGTDLGLLRLHDGLWRPVPGAEGAGVVRFFLRAHDGTLWMATDGRGVFAYRAGRFSHIAAADGLPSDLVRALYEDPRGRVWVGTEGRGLARLTPVVAPDGRVTATDIRSVRQRDGLFDEVIHAILPDGAGRLWMSTNRGIFWVRSDELDAFANGRLARVQSTSYTERDGLRNREANGGYQPTAVRATDGRLWFATQDGAVVVDPATVGRNQVPPPVLVEQVRTRHGIRPMVGDSVRLAPDERSAEIDYTGLSFVAPENVRFRYRLEGLDDGWVDAGSRRTAFYTNVPPGSYTFRVVASNNDGVWNEEGAAVAIRVTPRFTETPLARLLAALALALAGVAGYAWRVRRLRARAGELEQLVETRTAQLRAQEASLQEQNAQLAVQARRLAEMDEAKSRLFANVSHELRTPLTLILGPLKGLLAGRHGALSAGARDQGALMLRNGQRLLRLINQLLDLAKLQADELVLERHPVDLVAFVREASQAFAPLAEWREVALRFNSSVPNLTVAFDPARLENVLFNLLSNALKFTEPRGTVDIALASDAGGATLTVRDTGVGIAAAELPHVFERFYQADTTSTRRYEGTGIGLALARELVALHGGTLAAASTPGTGSTFTLWLPRTAADPGVPAAPSGARTGLRLTGPQDPDDLAAAWDVRPLTDHDDSADHDTAGDRTTVLVVDDNPDVRAYLRSILAPSYRVIEAADGAAGLERAQAFLPDLMIADVMMPVLDGFALSRALKGDAMTDAIPVVLLTARASPEAQVAGFETGADAYLVKPFDPAVLDACVSALLTQRRRLRARFTTAAPQPGAAAPQLAPTPHGSGAAASAPDPAPDGDVVRANAAPSALVQRLRDVITSRLADPTLDPKALAAAAGLSYHQMYRALRDDGVSPSRFIRGVRAECAAELLRHGAGSVTEVAYAVGFESLSYFSRAFRERFGAAPSAYLAPSAAAPPAVGPRAHKSAIDVANPLRP
ncbi:MAG TPA: two-component regulator propeller domain-containing protein [Gemmatirosa sp.]